MIVGVVGNLMALGHDAPRDFRISRDIAPDDVEGRAHAILAEDVEQLRRQFGMGAIIEGQRDDRARHGNFVVLRGSARGTWRRQLARGRL